MVLKEYIKRIESNFGENQQTAVPQSEKPLELEAMYAINGFNVQGYIKMYQEAKGLPIRQCCVYLEKIGWAEGATKYWDCKEYVATPVGKMFLPIESQKVSQKSNRPKKERSF